MHIKIKRLFTGALIFIIYLVMVQVCFSAPKTVNTSEPELYVFNDSPAIMYNGVCFVPIRKLCEYVGAEMEWMQSSKTIIITYRDTEIKMRQFNKYVTIAPKGASYSSSQIMDMPVITYNGKSYVTAKFIAACFMSTVDLGERYLQIDTYENELLTGTPTKSALFPILANPDLNQFSKIPQARVINESTIPKNDLYTLKSKLPDVFKELSVDSDISVSLANGSLYVYIPLINSYCQNINYQNDPYNDEYFYRVRTKEMTLVMQRIANVIYQGYKNEMDSGLWQKYSSGIKVTMINSRKETLSLFIPFKLLKIGNYSFYLPNSDYYQIYLNNKLLGGQDVEGWTDRYDNKLIQFFNAPVTEPLTPYFNVVDTSIPF